MDYIIYKTIHLLSLAVLFLSFGMILVASFQAQPGKLKKWGFALHGISWLTLLGSAFGLVSFLGLHAAFPTWAKFKTYIWIALGLSVIALARKSKFSALAVLMICGLATTAIWLAIAKPSF